MGDTQRNAVITNGSGAQAGSAPGPICKRWALLVGVNQYVEQAFPPLKFCVNDVLALEEVLRQLKYEVVTLCDTATEERLRPTRINVEAALEGLCQEAGPDDLILVHFACHGMLLDGRSLLITREILMLTLAETALPLTALIDRMKKSRARRLVLTLDACHAGVEMGRAAIDPDKPAFMRNVYELAEGFALIAGSTAQQVAQEWNEKQHGVFTYYLLQGLSGAADRTRKGFVTVDDLRGYALDGLRTWSAQHGGFLQDPTARIEGMGDMDLGAYAKPRDEPNPFSPGRPIMQPRHFFGRTHQLRRLFGLWRQVPLQNPVILGPKGSGKSSLLRYVQGITTTPPEELRPDQRDGPLTGMDGLRFISVDFEDPRLRTRQGIFRYLLEQLKLPVPEPCDLDGFMNAVSDGLKVPTVILLDEVGVALERYKELDNEFFESLRALDNNVEHLGFAVFCHKDPVELAHATGHTSPFFNVFGLTVTLEPLTEPEARALIASSPRPFSEEDVTWILAQSGRWPLLLQQLCLERLLALQDGEADDGWKEEGLRQLTPYRCLLGG